ncbi:MAG: HAMP domain-containing protein, partial [Ignavibacteria bacterium]|nr:HAMP domain-containing protein [Ignavibacteria bacterium]
MKSFLHKITPRLGIQGKLTLIFILLSTIPLILVSIFTVKQQIDFKQDENLREMESDIKGLKERTSLFLTRVESEINLVMKSTELKKLTGNLMNDTGIDDQLQENAEKEFLNIVTDNDFYIKIDLLNKKGREILSVINDEQTPYAVKKSDLSRTTKNYYVQMVRDLKPGEIELSPSEIRVPDSDAFAPVIDFILPFYDESEKVTAIVTVKIRAEKLFELLVPSYGNSPKKIFIVNGEGYYIFNSERKDNWSSLFTDRYDENIFKDYSEEIALKIFEGKEKTTISHKERIIQSSPIFSGSKAVTDRYFIIEDVDAEVVMSSTDELQLILFVLILVVAILSLVAGFLTARRFLKPVKQLIKGTQIIRSGNLDYKLEIKTKDEIQDLINNFNQLVVEWKQKQLLEKEVQKSEKLFSSLTQTA